jgi:hypothetical protein
MTLRRSLRSYFLIHINFHSSDQSWRKTGARAHRSARACEDGSVVVKLLKAFYGYIESSGLWSKDLREELMRMGFTHNQKDHCVFGVLRGGHQMSVSKYIEDLFATSIDESDLE